MTAVAARTDWRVVALMAAGFGLVGIDRFMISTLYPVIARDLGLGYGAIGVVTGALAFAWGAAALVMGNRADRLGRRRVLVGALIAFSLLIGASGLAAGLASLVAVRVVMGLADGAYTPASIATTLQFSAPHHHGLAIGLQQMMLPAIGLGVAPLLIAQLLHVVDWRWTFVCFALPGLAIAWAVHRFVPQPGPDLAGEGVAAAGGADWRRVLGYRNVRLAMALMLCWLVCLVTTSAFLPSYLLDARHVPFTTMSRIMAAIGLGSAAGTLCLAWASDVLGRRPVMLLASSGACVSLLGFTLAQAPGSLFALLFAVHFFNNAAITLTVGPLCAEAVPPALMGTASGLVIATGELIGGGASPILAGLVATRFGIGELLWLPIGALAIGTGISFFLNETVRATAPARGRT